MHTTNRTDVSSETRAGRVAGVVSAGVLLVAFGAMALGIEQFWIAFPVGYGAVLPLAVSYAKSTSDPARSDSFDRLKRRYVDGEIDEATFERELDARLRETERE